MDVPKRGRGRPRREGADAAILSIALDALREHGYRDLSVDDVAARARVAKTTVYRRWPSKGALVAAAIAPRLDAARLARSAGADALVASVAEACALLTLFGGADVDREITDVLRDAFRNAIDRRDAELIADLVAGTLVVTRQPLDDAFARTLVRKVLATPAG